MRLDELATRYFALQVLLDRHYTLILLIRGLRWVTCCVKFCTKRMLLLMFVLFCYVADASFTDERCIVCSKGCYLVNVTCGYKMVCLDQSYILP